MANCVSQSQPVATKSTHTLRLLLLALAILTTITVSYWLSIRKLESTDNAYVHANILHLSAPLSGTIKQLHITNHQAVKAGTVLMTIDDTTITTPFDAYIENFTLRTGQYLQSGKPLLALIESNNPWIEANFKETQVAAIRPDNPVSITLDTCPDQRLQGHVIAIGHATGSVFALLPPQNASSHWVKVNQRIPVKIQFDAPSDNCQPVVGSSATVTVSVQ